LRIELQRELAKSNNLLESNNNLQIELNGKNLENDILKDKIKELDLKESLKGDNLGHKDFLLHLGTLIYNQCEKTVKNTEINKCKDLYFKYVKEND
jgi:hypothetical protein